MKANRTRTRRTLPLATLALLSLTALAFTGCDVEAKLGDPALPANFEDKGVPSASLQTYVYFDAGSPVGMPSSLLGIETGEMEGTEIHSVEGIINNPSTEIAGRVEFSTAADAEALAERAVNHVGDARWVESNGTYVMVGQPTDGAWTDSVRRAWEEDDRQPVSQAYPEAWATLRLLPPKPPMEPVAAGFFRNAPQMAGELMSKSGLEIPGLDSAFGLIRIDTVAFAAYADDTDNLPTEPTTEALSDSGGGMIAAATSGYPGYMIGFLFSRFSERAGLEETTVDGSSAYHRAIGDDLHLLVKAYGSTFFFAVAPTREGADELMVSVIESQQGE